MDSCVMLLDATRRVAVRRNAVGCSAAALAAAVWFVLAANALAANVRVEAFTAEPWGVGRVTIDVTPEALDTATRDDRYAVMEKQGRIMYPVVAAAPMRDILQGLLPIRLPGKLQIYFLFRGNEPLDLQIFSPAIVEDTVALRVDRRRHQELLNKWWREYARMFERVHREAEYPIVVQNYLTAVWSRRLGASMPEPPEFLFRPSQTGGTWFPQLFADEAYRAAVERDLLLGRFDNAQPADQPIPFAPVPPPDKALTAEIEIEAMASHVPAECYYLRFGSFENYLWFRDFLSRWRGEIGNMLVTRSIDRNIGPKIEEQIALKESKLARVMGPTVIRDVAIVGMDPYFRDGPAFGILFHARNNLLLGNDFRSQRRQSRQEHPDASDNTVRVAGHEVAFLSTPDGSVRSYYAVDGDFHFVTNCRRMVERFYAAGNGFGALAADEEFGRARQSMPLSRDDTIFAYVSRQFLENLASPQYRVELDRRLRSVGEMRMLQMAKFAARAEGLPGRDVADLIDGGLLPSDFGLRSDGSALVTSDDRFYDSHRGHRGRFMPIPDVPAEAASAAEWKRFQQFRNLLQTEAGQPVPITFSLRRSEIENGDLDHVAVQINVAPYLQTQLARLVDKLGPITDLQLAPIDGDVAAGEIVLQPLGEPVHLFAGLRDFHTPLEVSRGTARIFGAYDKYVRGYVGAFPRLYWLDKIFGPPAPPDRQGYAHNRGLLGLLETWHRRVGDFFVFSFQRDVLENVGPQLAMVPARRPAQVRLRLTDLSQTELSTAVTGLGYRQARLTSASATRFMNALVQQLQVPLDEAREVGEDLISGGFHCPLGGEYLVAEEPGGLPIWISTAPSPANRFLLTEIPSDYRLPLLEWFRGLTADVTRDGDSVTLFADLVMVPQKRPATKPADANSTPAREASWKLPDLDFLNPFGKQKQRPAEGASAVPRSTSETLPDPEKLPSPRSG